MSRTPRKVIFAAALALTCVLMFKNTDGFDSSEFSGGSVTGPMLTMTELSLLVLGAAILTTFRSVRVASVFALVGVSLCVPMMAYVIAPGPFRRVLGGEYSVRLQSAFYWNVWWVGAGLAVIAVVFLSLWNLVCSRTQIEDAAS